ncbi:hypothetical protein SprV_0200894100 [Sparganum proliferum]
MRNPLYTTFVDLKKAVDSVNRLGLWKIMQKFGCPQHFTHMVRQLHDEMMARITNSRIISEAFVVAIVVNQGCAFALTLISLMFTAMLMDAYRDEQPGIHIAYRTDEHLNGKRIQAATRLSAATVHDALSPDDCALSTKIEENKQRSMRLYVDP